MCVHNYGYNLCLFRVPLFGGRGRVRVCPMFVVIGAWCADVEMSIEPL